MSFIETVRRARELLHEEGRISLSALKLEFELDGARLESLIEELVDVQQVAAREGKVLAWIGAAAAEASALELESRATPAASSDPAEAPQAAEAERRQLTVLFCDLVDSTKLAAGLDPEDWREVVRAYQAAAAEVIERYEGHIAQYLGDGLLVYFGWPQAHEDDAERAVRAGLGVVDALAEASEAIEAKHGVHLEVRVGIHTGPVVVGVMGGGERKETLALGDTTNLAARIQSEAEPNTVVLGAATLRLVSGIFVTHELGQRALKGIDEPVPLHRADRPSGMRSRLDVAAATGLTPLIGREQELGLLEDRFAQVGEGLGQAVLICGEAGIGKSRLMQAFRERIAERAHSWLECRCSPYTQDSALFPVLELQRQGLGLRAEDPPDAKLDSLEVGLQASGFELGQSLPLMASFHGLPLPEHYAEPALSPEARRKQTLELLVEWLLRLGRLQPLVLLMEDLHWVDPSTQELLGQILERIPREQVLLLATYRPDFAPPWGAKSHLTPMLLARLTRPQLGNLIRKAARDRDLPEAWLEEIIRRSDGVPLFAEELTKTVLESNPPPPERGEAPTLHIPETLQDSLTARIDQLGPVKEIAQLASVLGREFSYDLLLKVSPLGEEPLRRVLADAVTEELFYQRGTPPDASYLFKHALIRDAAYQSLLRSTRRRHHRRVAATLIEWAPALAEAQPELVAHHLAEAGDDEGAIGYWQRAGERANARVAHEEAIRHLRRGIKSLEGLEKGSVRDERELSLQMAMGRALNAARGWGHPDTQKAWDRARTLCDPVTDPLRAAAIHWSVVSNLNSRGDSRAALESATQLMRLGEQASETVHIAGLFLAGISFWWLGRFAESRDCLAAVISVYDADRLRRLLAEVAVDVGAGAHSWAAWAYWSLGFPDRAWVISMEALEHERRRRQPFALAAELAWASGLAVSRRDWVGAESLGAEAARLAAEQNFPLYEAIASFMRVLGSEAEQGDPSAVDAYTAAAARLAGSGSQGGVPLVLGNLAGLQLRAGQVEEAAATVQGALAIARQMGQSFHDAELHRQRGEIFLQLEDHTEDEAEGLFRKAIEIAQGQEAKSFELRAATSLARLWQRQGKRVEARDLLAPVYDWFTEGFDTQDLKEAKALLDELA